MTISALAATAGTLIFPLAMVYAGVMDLMTMKIRNAVVLFILAAWLLLAPLAGFSLAELGWSMAGASVVFAITFALFARGWIGGGDAKLAAVTALWFQPGEALIYFLYASILGGALTLVVLKLRSATLPAVFYRAAWLTPSETTRTGVPYGAALAPAALIVFPHTAWVSHAVL